MKRETLQFAKGRKNKWRNKYNHVWLYLYLLIAKKIRKEKALGRHTKSPIRSPCPIGGLCGIAPYPSVPPGNSKKLVQTVCTSMLVTGCALSPIPAAMPSCWNYLGFVSEP